MLGVHGCVAVAAVTVQNSVGVKGFHEIPLDVITGQIEAVVEDIGIQAAKTGMLASSEIITAVAETWRGLDTDAPLVVDPVCASMHGDPLLHPSALNALRTELFPIATLVTPNLDEVRLITDIDVVDTDSQRDAARALHALGPQWALVKGGHLRSSDHSADLLFDGTDFYEFDAERIDTGHDHGAGDTLAAATACALAHGYSVPDAVAVRQTVGHRMSARRLPVGPRPRPRLRPVSASSAADEILTPSRGSRTGRTATRRGPSR